MALKLGTQTGSLMNHLMSGSEENKPEVGKGATELHWTDRSAYFVNEVSEDGKSCIIERAKAVRVDKNGMSDSQDYRYEREEKPQLIQLKFKWGKWRREVVLWNGKKEYQPMNIKFGFMREYYDYSF